MPRITKDRISGQFSALLCGAIGFLLGVFYGYSPVIEYEWKLSLNQVFSGIVALLLALLATWVLDRRKTDSRVERDLLLSRAEQQQTKLKTFEELAQGEKYDYRVASAALKQARTSLADFKKCLLRHGYSTPAQECENLDGYFSELKNILTDGSDKTGKSKAKIRNNFVPLDDIGRRSVEAQIAKLHDCYFTLSLAINSG